MVDKLLANRSPEVHSGRSSMSFVSVAFLLFLPVVFALHWAGRSRVWQNAMLVGASYLFYGWWDWRFCFLLLAVSLVDYVAGAALDRHRDHWRRRMILVAALGTHLAVLGFFKYFDFFVESLALALSLAGWDIPTGRFALILPVGISFYTFQTMSYTLDIYRGHSQQHRSLLDYLAFVSFFPQLVAGPIERAGQLLPQYATTRTFDPAEAREGCRFILWGFAKKMLLADNLALLVDQAYAVPAAASSAVLALATLAFAFQIYCDFSAYSDIAVGSARLFGIRLSRNFAYPYFAQTLSEFWRRWHISLSTWFRDYVFIPLGGSRTTPGRTARNLLFTALISGLWHGAAWHFVGWGAVHGLFLGASRLRSRWRIRASSAVPAAEPARAGDTGTAPGSWTALAGISQQLDPFDGRGSRGLGIPGGAGILPSWGVLLRMGRTFGLVCGAWVLFRAQSLEEACSIYGSLLCGFTTPAFYTELGALAVQHAGVLLALGGFVAIEWLNRQHWNTLAVGQWPLPLRWAIYTGLAWMCVSFGTERTEEFIYFRF